MEVRPISPLHEGSVLPRMRLDDHTLDEELPAAFPWYNQGRFHPPATCDIGTLDMLPTELLDEILLQLDLFILTNFRRVNRRGDEVVNALPQYRAIATHAPNALIGPLRIGTGGWITCKDLYKTLCSPNCVTCGDFGGYIYLITCRRVCFLCFTGEKIYLPLAPETVCREFGLQPRTVDTLPHMFLLPGMYTWSEKNPTQSTLVESGSALAAGIALHGSETEMDCYVSNSKSKEMKAYKERQAAAVPFGGHVRQPYNPESSVRQCGFLLRFVAIIRVPWFDTIAQEMEWGFHCLGCRNSNCLPLHHRRQFTTVLFDQHLKEFGPVQGRVRCAY